MKDLRLEFVIRLKQGRFTVSEYIIRPGDEVEAINYWPSGSIHNHGTMSLSQFIEAVQKVREEKST